MNKDIFLKHLNSFQDEAIKELKNHNKVIIKSTKYTGKSVICKKLFNSLNNGVIIYHTGCAPKLFKNAKNRLLELINVDKEITLILDEFYDNELLELISNKNNINCYVVTNDSS